MSLYGPPDDYFIEGPLDCPVCVDGIELEGNECEDCHGPVCPKHGCPRCSDMEKARVYCSGPYCGNYLRAGVTPVMYGGRTFCSEACKDGAIQDDKSVLEQEMGWDDYNE